MGFKRGGHPPSPTSISAPMPPPPPHLPTLLLPMSSPSRRPFAASRSTSALRSSPTTLSCGGFTINILAAHKIVDRLSLFASIPDALHPLHRHLYTTLISTMTAPILPQPSPPNSPNNRLRQAKPTSMPCCYRREATTWEEEQILMVSISSSPLPSKSPSPFAMQELTP